MSRTPDASDAEDVERGPNVDSEAPCPRQRGYARCQDREKPKPRGSDTEI